MYKAKILVISVVFLIVFSFIVVSQDEQKPYNEMNRGDQEEFLIELFGEGTTITPDDVSIDPYTGTVFINNGYAVLTDIGFLVVLNGGFLGVKEYTGHIEISKGGSIYGTNGVFHLGKGGTVTVINGVVQLRNVNLRANSLIEYNGENIFLNGKDISYDSTTGKIISKDVFNIGGGIFFMKDNIVLSPQSDEGFSYNIKTKKVEGNVHIYSDKLETPEYLLEGRAIIKSMDEIVLLADEDNPSIIRAPKKSLEASIKVTANTCVGKDCKDEGISRLVMDGSRGFYSNLHIHAKNDNNIEIRTPDSFFSSVIVVAEIKDDSTVDLVLTKKRWYDKRVRFVFSNKKPIVKGDLVAMLMDIGHVFSDKEGMKVPWMIYNGREYTGNKVGEVIGAPSIIGIKLKILRNLNSRDEVLDVIESLGEIEGELAVEAIRLFPDDLDVQKRILDRIGIGHLGLREARELMLLFPNDEYIQNKIIDKMSIRKMYDPGFRVFLLEAANEDIIKRLLERGVATEGWDSDDMLSIYSSPEFLSQTEGLDNVQQWSVALSAVRLVTERQEEEISPENIAKATNEIMNYRDSIADQTIIDSETTVIPITHSDKNMFSNEYMIEFAEDSGAVVPEHLRNLVGGDAKDEIIDAIENSDGKTTIWFNVHGGPDVQLLGYGKTLNEKISYEELGDSLINRGNIDEVTLMIDSCYSYDFRTNLYNYLSEKEEETGQSFGTPNIITETNRGQLGYGGVDDYVDTKYSSWFLYGLNEAKEKGEPLRYSDLYEAEKYFFRREDMSISVRSQDEIISIGSDNDDLEILPSGVDALGVYGSPSEEGFVDPLRNQQIIEIGQIEPEMADMLYG